MTTRIRTYSELRRLNGFLERYRYLRLQGQVGEATFGWDRWMNQKFYQSVEWRRVRDLVILRDNGCDLGVDGHEIHERITIHHMNPIVVQDFANGNEDILDPRFLISVSLSTHNAIHYGDERLLPREYVPRRPGDTKLW